MKNTFAFVLCAALPLGCGDDNNPEQPDASVVIEPDAPVAVGCTVTPGPWSAPNFADNANAPLALRAQLDLLVGNSYMRGAELGTVTTIDAVAKLDAVYNAGFPVLSANAHTAFDLVVDDAFAEFVPIITAGVRDMVTTSWDPGTDGGLYDSTRRAGFNTGGIEVRQIVDKGAFAGGVLYHYALKQTTTGKIDDAVIDRIAAAWGSNATLDPATKTDSANYSHAMGFHAKIAKALTDAKAYAADPMCNTERDKAIVDVFRLWEQSMFARALHYGNAGVAGVATATTDALTATALHAYSEGLGLVIGFHGLPHPTSGPLAGAGRKMTDADIEAILTNYGVNRTNLAASTVGTLVTDTTTWQTGVTAAENKIKQVFQLTDAEITKYRAALVSDAG